MMQLSREIRFALVDDFNPQITNSWSGWPATTKIVPQLVLTCVVEGDVDKTTGYICNIKDLDHLLRDIISNEIIPNQTAYFQAENLLRKIHKHCQEKWHSDVRIVQQTLTINPYLSFTIRSSNETMIELTQQFEFSAAHRLHCESLSEKENQKVFGKCNNPLGHGHNYVVEISVTGDVDETNGQLIEIHEFESTVKQLVVDRLDHKNLNQDIDYFANVNPTVENITKAIWNWLDGRFGNSQLSNVRVYETPKTWADYNGR